MSTAVENRTPRASTENHALLTWVDHMARLMKPDCIVWCDGSEAEKRHLTQKAVDSGVLIPLNPRKRPGCYLHRSDPSDVSDGALHTFMCTPTREAGSTNNWMPPSHAYQMLRKLLLGSMRGRTMYVIPYAMGPAGSPFSKVGVELTDSLYVVLSMRIMVRVGQIALDMLGNSADFNRGIHAFHPTKMKCQQRFICDFPQDNTVWAVGGDCGDDAVLPQRSLGLRIGSYLGRKEGWLAEHMSILGLESPDGRTTYFAAAFPDGCGKTNLAMMVPPRALEGWRVLTIGDDIAWIRLGRDGQLWAINPVTGYFGPAPGTNWESNPTAMRIVERDTIFTNVALTPDGDVWWEGLSDDPPEGTLDWRGRPWERASGEAAARPNSRFTAPMRNNPALSPRVGDLQGVPITAILFGGRRADTIPLVLQSFDWAHGVYLGATLGSEATSAAGIECAVHRNPMGMLPFSGYNLRDYLAHWLSIGNDARHAPKIFMVNWFRKDADGRFLWPGYGENVRILKWIAERTLGRIDAEKTPVGWVPRQASLELTGLEVQSEHIAKATSVHLDEWSAELRSQLELFEMVDSPMPPVLRLQREMLVATLGGVERRA